MTPSEEEWGAGGSEVAAKKGADRDDYATKRKRELSFRKQTQTFYLVLFFLPLASQVAQGRTAIEY